MKPTKLHNSELTVTMDDAQHQAFTQWYRSEYNSVVALVFVLSGSKWAAEEIAQEAFMKAHRNWADISGYQNPGAWVRKVAVNNARSWGRRKGAETRALAKHLLQRRDTPNDMPDTSHEFWAQVRKLPERQAQVIALHYLDDLPVEQIAELLGIAPGTVKAQLHNGRNNLKKQLGLPTETSTTTESDASTPGENS